MSSIRLIASWAAVALAFAHPAPAQPGDAVPLADVLEIVVLERQILAIDAEGGGQVEERLELNERVLWTASKGTVGVALTDRRVLAVGTRSGAWQQARYRRVETRPTGALLGDRLALVTTDRRLLGFNGVTGNLIERDIAPREFVVDRGVEGDVSVVVTNRHAFGLAAFVGGWFPIRLGIQERFQSLKVRSGVATVTTDRRLLIFRGNSGSWEERRLDAR